MGPNGELYVTDADRILGRLTDGKFAVVAGTGEQGFSGDGGPAIRAQLDDPGGMTFGPGGDLYLADRGDGRVRRITPSGIITTVAGGGSSPTPGRSEAPLLSGTPALDAHLAWPSKMSRSVPHGLLYIADEGSGEIVRLDANGTLAVVAGGPRAACGGICGAGGPATDAGTDGPSGIAFNRAGDLFIAGSDTKGLLLVTPRGVMETLSEFGFYARGDGGLVTTPSGGVIGMTDQNVVSVGPNGWRDIYSFSSHGFPSGDNAFLPNGLAVSPSGAIYLDTTAGNGWTRLSAIAVLGAKNTPRLLWSS